MLKNNEKQQRHKSCKPLCLIIFSVLMINLIGISLVSAFEFDNVKNYDDKIGSYGRIEIRNSMLGFEWWQLNKITTLQLKTNTELCYEGCEATKEIVMYEDGKLIDNIRFVDLETGAAKTIKDYNFKVKINDKWVDYNYEEVKGNSDGIVYEFKIEGILKPFQSVDWQIKSQGIWITEWAEWTDALSVGLMAYWNFEQDTQNLTQLNDVATRQWNGTLIDSPTFNIDGGIIGDSLTFSNSTNDTVSIDPMNFNTTNITLSFWQKRPSTGASISDLYLGTIFGGNATDGIVISTRSNFLGWSTQGEGAEMQMGNNNLTNGTWHHVVMVRAGLTQNLIYIDGERQTLSQNSTKRDADPSYHFIGSTESGIEDWNGDIDEFGIWNRALTQTEILQLFNNGTGITSPISVPGIFLNSPIDNFNTVNTSILFNCSTKSSDGVNNATLIIDGSNNFTITNSSAFQNLSLETTVNGFNFSAHNWTCSITSGTNVTTTQASRDFEVVRVIVNNQSFNNATNEGATETFFINFTKASSLQVSTVNLIYDSVQNSFPYLVSENQIISESSIAIPVQDSNINLTFFWNILFSDDSSFNVTPSNQSVSVINLDNCTSFTNLVYNFTQYDEETKVALTQNNTMEIQFNLYDNSKTLLISNFSQKFVGANPAQVCLENPIIEGVSYSSEVIAKYFANESNANQSHAIEYYNILNESISNATIPLNKALYDLKEEDTTKFRLTFRDSSYVLAPNILVQVHRQYIEDNDFKIVEIPLTDSNGQTIMNLVRNTIIYNFIMVDEAGNTVATFNSLKVFCQDFTIGECTILLAPDSDAEPVFDYNDEFGISVTTPSYDNSTEIVSISFVTDDLQPKSVRMDVFRNNDFGNRSVCSDSLTAASGLLSCSVSSIVDSDQFLFVYFYVEDDLANQYTINLNASTLSFGVINGAFYAFLIILLLITLFMDDKKVLVISLGLGWVVIISLGLMNGTLVGATSAGIWILVTIAIFIWKLNKEEGA